MPRRRGGARARRCSGRKSKVQMAASRRWAPVGLRRALGARQRRQGEKMRDPAGEGVRDALVPGGHHGAVTC